MKRFEVWLARLDPAEGSEMRKTRPVVIVSPDDMNARLLIVGAVDVGPRVPRGRSILFTSELKKRLLDWRIVWTGHLQNSPANRKNILNQAR